MYQRGNASDLEYIYQQSVSPDGFAPEVRLTALDGLAEAALTRKVQPKGNLSSLRRLIRLA